MVKNRFFVPILLLGLLLPPTGLISLVNTSTTKTLYPISDSYVSSIEGDLSSNFGGKSHLEISYSTNIFGGIKIGYLMFHLSSIPTNAIIQSAQLQLHTSFLTETHTIGVYYCPDNTWIEYEITGENSPSFREKASDTVIVAKDGTEYSWDVTSDVETALDSPESKLSLVIKSETEHDLGWVWFYSRDQEYSWMEKYRPNLTVVYDIPSPPKDTSNGQDASDSQETYTPTSQDTYSPSVNEILAFVVVIAIFSLILIAFLFSVTRKKGKTQEDNSTP